MTTRQQISPPLADIRAEVCDVLAEALETILLQRGLLTTGSRHKPKPANESEQQSENKRL